MVEKSDRDDPWVSGNTVDGRNPAPPKKTWNDDSTVNTNKQRNHMMVMWFQSGAEFRPSTVSPRCFCGLGRLQFCIVGMGFAQSSVQKLAAEQPTFGSAFRCHAAKEESGGGRMSLPVALRNFRAACKTSSCDKQSDEGRFPGHPFCLRFVNHSALPR